MKTGILEVPSVLLILIYIMRTFTPFKTRSFKISLFNLKELKDLYVKRMEFHGCAVMYAHSTRFKGNILALIPELTEYKEGGRHSQST